MYLIAGLGNPGRDYVNTRHNVGFEAISVLSSYYDIPLKKIKHKAVFGEGKISGEQVILAQPQTYMNNSGNAVGPLMAFYKIPLENVIVIHDDMDLKIGDMRQKIGGGSGGHNGIKSIDAAVGNGYHRVRIGIGHPRDFELPMDPADWVLGRFGAVQMEIIKNTIDQISII